MTKQSKRPNVYPSHDRLVEVRLVESGEVALATQWSGEEWQVYLNGHRPTMMTLTPWGNVAERTGREIGVEEVPLYLRPLYVPGPIYHGHWLYIDGWWLSRPDKHTFTGDWYEYLLSICGFMRDDFDYPQLFYEWIYRRWPDGLFLHELKTAVTQEKPTP